MSHFLFQVRRGTSAQWAARNTVLRSGEPGYETDRKKLKIGDGLTAWNDLDYINMADVEVPLELQQHIDSETPHPVYDDMPSIVLLYENAKV